MALVAEPIVRLKYGRNDDRDRTEDVHHRWFSNLRDQNDRSIWTAAKRARER